MKKVANKLASIQKSKDLKAKEKQQKVIQEKDADQQLKIDELNRVKQQIAEHRKELKEATEGAQKAKKESEKAIKQAKKAKKELKDLQKETTKASEKIDKMQEDEAMEDLPTNTHWNTNKLIRKADLP